MVFPHFSLHPHGEYSKPSVMCSRCHNIHSDGDRFQFCDGLWVCGCLVCKSHFQSQWPICVQANIPQKELAQLVRDAVRPLSGDLGPPAASKRVLHRAESSVQPHSDGVDDLSTGTESESASLPEAHEEHEEESVNVAPASLWQDAAVNIFKSQ